MRYLTAGESHGKELIGIIEGMPSGLKIDVDYIDERLALRQKAAGRGERSALCADKAEILSGLDDFVTTGAPIAISISNGNCGEKGSFDFFRPGHVDFAASKKYNLGAAVGAERASARETAMRTALGGLAMQFLAALGIKISAYVSQIGEVCAVEPLEIDEKFRCDPGYVKAIESELINAKKSGDTLGGKVVVKLEGVIPGIGSHVFFDRRLDGILSGAFMSIPAVKAVECGLGVGFAGSSGKEVADRIRIKDGSAVKLSNNQGGIEGGISNGEDIVFSLTFKPIPGVVGIETIDILGNECLTQKVRGDICAAPSGCIVAESVAALAISSAILDCLGGDTMDEVIYRYKQKGSGQCKRFY